jgi:hypothetical protein
MIASAEGDLHRGVGEAGSAMGRHILFLKSHFSKSGTKFRFPRD